MSSHWTYDDIYGVVIQYIHEQLIPQNLALNFGVIALCETSPKVFVRFTLKDLNTNRSRQWEVQLEGETVQELTHALHMSVEDNKARL